MSKVKCVCCGGKKIKHKGREYDHYYVMDGKRRTKVYSRILNDESQTEVFYDDNGNETGRMT